MPNGPLMDRDEQYGAAPQVFLPVQKQEYLTYTPGQNIYTLSNTASRITAVQVYGYESSDPIVRGPGYTDNVSLVGQTYAYTVRLFEGNEEARILDQHVNVQYSGTETYNETSMRMERNFTVAWNPPQGADPFAEWEFPLGTPQEHIELEELPIATPPTGDPEPYYGPPVVEGNEYRVYTNGMVNTQGATITFGGNAIDLSQANPKPRQGPMIVYYESPINTLMDKT